MKQACAAQALQEDTETNNEPYAKYYFALDTVNYPSLMRAAKEKDTSIIEAPRVRTSSGMYLTTRATNIPIYTKTHIVTAEALINKDKPIVC